MCIQLYTLLSKGSPRHLRETRKEPCEHTALVGFLGSRKFEWKGGRGVEGGELAWKEEEEDHGQSKT